MAISCDYASKPTDLGVCFFAAKRAKLFHNFILELKEKEQQQNYILLLLFKYGVSNDQWRLNQVFWLEDQFGIKNTRALKLS